MEKEKEKLISDFEKSFKQKEKVDANELMEELFPKGKELSYKDTKLKQRIEKLIEELNKESKNKNLNNNNDSNYDGTKRKNINSN
jgi:hypothetical protein